MKKSSTETLFVDTPVAMILTGLSDKQFRRASKIVGLREIFPGRRKDIWLRKDVLDKRDLMRAQARNPVTDSKP